MLKSYFINQSPDIIHKRNNSVLINFLQDDWTYLFNGNYDNKKNYYVYYHTRPDRNNLIFKNNGLEIEFKGIPFYIGKGKLQRYKVFDSNYFNEVFILYRLLL